MTTALTLMIRYLRLNKHVPSDVREAAAAELGMEQTQRQQAQAETFRRRGDLVNR